ncbi:DNA polymerase III subunit alpha [Candidatus Aerophobetes bacterium]|uniref:DNA polymerase III subunit alpha n=1 Tax=Aerophobetes bacterium TaxID=2030807 RepID=A0A523W9C1_UNCAE|nr:MAG: DNA polymerase III subunit alpha [Candidatus Aerophobetes bacterium]
MKEFSHLHIHSDYSLLDGACSISQLVNQAYRFDMGALALTDHGNLFGAIDFYTKAKKRGIKPIIGCEVYVAPASRFRKRKQKGEGAAYHLTLLAKDKQGYCNLMELASCGYLEGFYYSPRVDKDILSQKGDGLVALSGCLKGEIASLLVQDDLERARKVCLFYRDLFGDDFYLELQSQGLEEQKKINPVLIELSRELSIPLVATNDVHYLTREDAIAQDVLLCIQTGKTLEDKDRLRFSSSEFYFRSSKEMDELFSHTPEALSNSVAIADKCSLKMELGKVYLPLYQTPTGYDLDQYLRKLCEEKLPHRYPEISPQISERMERELQIIRKMGYAGYFLVVWDFIRYAKERKIVVGPGRGSVAGSLVAYVLGITDIDPLSYGLFFERFLNPERTAMPDIDIDIEDERRGEVIEYVRQKYGQDNVAQIITFGTMAARAAVRDVGRVLGMPYGKVDRIAKFIPFNRELRVALEESSELKELMEEDEKVRSLFEIAQRIEGLTRHASTHAAGVVIAPDKLTHYTPLYRSSKDEITTQYEMHSLENIGLLKMDFLGLKTLNVINHALKLIRKNKRKELDLDEVSLEDEPTYQVLSRGETLGVFQVESRGMQDLLRKLKPQKFEDLIALLALYRPGPLHSRMVDEFISRRHGRSEVKYLHPKLEPILKETYGVILYQEQVMQIANVLAGFSLGEADILRRAMGKKKPKLMDEQREKFLEGTGRSGIQPSAARRIFELMAHFAGYGFNKSHSTGYALIAYQTAYLKANYPLEFMAALLNSERENTDKLALYISECKRMGILVLAPNINRSLTSFSVAGDRIDFGLTAIKNVGESAMSSIIEERGRDGSFTSIFDFCRRVNLQMVNKRVIQSLIRCGAFDCLSGHRSQNLAVMDQATEEASLVQRDRQRGQLSFLEALEGSEKISPTQRFPSIEEVPGRRKLLWEKELLGIYVSGHPLDRYRKRITHYLANSVRDLRTMKEGSRVRVIGVVNNLTLKRDRKGKMMAFLRLEDLTSEIEVVTFSRLYEEFASYLEEGKLVLVGGRLDMATDSPKIVAEKIIPFSKINGSNQKLHVNISEEKWENIDLKRLKDIVHSHKGRHALYLHLTNSKEQRVTIRSKTIKVGFSDEFISQLEDVLGEGCLWLSEE